MSNKSNLHPSVQKFKEFVKKHPILIKEVREGNKTWQAFYEEWMILGEEDEFWEKYKKNGRATDEVASTEEQEKTEKSNSQEVDLLSLLKNIKLNDLQSHIQNLSGMMASVQGLLQTFQPNQKNSEERHEQPGHRNPFNFRQF